ncbi:hypothetical protein [Streptomyces durocortorensis]|uniref:hypothetical protein n=1 Tax=Streptomyces durocortorensis TaxID=2811104 RepID=UPI003556C2C8
MTTPAPSPGFLHTTRTSYDAIAEGYASWTRDELAAKPLERGLLTAFAELACSGRSWRPPRTPGPRTMRTAGSRPWPPPR